MAHDIFREQLAINFLTTDMPFGSQARGAFIPKRRRLPTSVTFAKANSNVSSIFCYPQKIRRTKILVFQSITNHSCLTCQIISTLVYFIPMTFVQPESAWSLRDWGYLPMGNLDPQSKYGFTHVFLDQKVRRKSHSHAEGKQVQYCPFQYQPSARTLYCWEISASG